MSDARDTSVRLLQTLRGAKGTRWQEASAEGAAGVGGWGGEREEVERVKSEDACRRHLRTPWFIHSPVMVCSVSRAVEEFLVAAEALFDANEVAACLAQLERLVQGLELEKVREALCQSQTHDVLICLCHLCVKLGVKCFLQKRRVDDGLVFFGSALVFAGRVQAGELKMTPCAGAKGEGRREGREEDSGDRESEWLALQGLLRAWALDQLAFCYAFVGEAESALSVTKKKSTL